jgi:hypothetical protein
VWRTWRSGQEASSLEHQQAVLQAITAARLSRLPLWRRQLARLWLLPAAGSRSCSALKATGKSSRPGLDTRERLTKIPGHGLH